MKIHFLSFASPSFYSSLRRIGEEAKNSDFFDSVTCIKSSDLSFFYRVKNFFLLKESTKKYGYWMWKSYVTKLLLHNIDFGDILLYADAGCVINKGGKKRFDEYVTMLNNSEYSNLSFQNNGHLEKEYTKGDLFKYFKLEHNEIIKNSGQLVATTFFLKKNDHSVSLIDQWYSICHTKKNLINDSISKYPNDPAFIQHRYDQSIFSLLRKLNGSLMIPNDTYTNDDKPIQARRLR